MRNLLTLYLITFIFITGCLFHNAHKELKLYDLGAGKELQSESALSQIEDKDIILVGEHHNNAAHHQIQLQVIRALHEARVSVAVGMEMFRQDSQDKLDQWVSGRIEEKDFVEIYLDNWNYDWQFYRPIFMYARDNSIPMVGLNVPREITSQVARKGFNSLTDKQRGLLPEITCNVSESYMKFIKRAYGAHAHGNLNFGQFCEAQLVWDTAMAIHAINYLKSNPGRKMVIIAGTGHARKMGIPDQVQSRSQLSFAVILPETAGSIDPSTITTQDADYIAIN